MAKIKKNLAHKEDKDRLSQEAKTAAEVALIAMGDSSYMGLCIQFLEKTYVTDNINDLARLLLQTTQNYGLNCSVQIRYDGVAVNMELDGMQRELESSLLTKMHTKGRYLEFANRAIINFPHISLLIKNMPVEDENKHGLFRDQLMILLQSTESRIGALVSEMQVKKQRAILEKMIGRTKDMLSTTDVRFVKLMTEGAQLIDSFVTQLDDKSKEMGLTELQEEELGAIGSECLQKSALLFSSVLKLDSQFGRIVDDLKAILGNEL